MYRLRRFVQLSSADRSLLLQSALLVVGVRLGLWFLPFQTLRCGLARLSHGPAASPQEDAVPVAKVALAVQVVSRYVPAASCLTQALATHVLLSRNGIPALLYIGVTKDSADRLRAHAWVVSEGQTVVGGSGSGAFTPLLILEGRRMSACDPG